MAYIDDKLITSQETEQVDIITLCTVFPTWTRGIIFFFLFDIA